MEETGQRLARKLFKKVEIFTFQNPLRFNSVDALYSYWSSYNLYDQKLAMIFESAAISYFKKHTEFETIKKVIGIRAIKL